MAIILTSHCTPELRQAAIACTRPINDWTINALSRIRKRLMVFIRPCGGNGWLQQVMVDGARGGIFIRGVAHVSVNNPHPCFCKPSELNWVSEQTIENNKA